MFRDEGDHCANCYCEPVKTYCGVRRRIFLKVILGSGTLSFIIMGILMVMHFARNSITDLGTVKAGLFACMLFNFLLSYIIVIYMESTIYLELLWSIVCGLYAYLCDGLSYIRDHVRLPSWQDILVLFSARRAVAEARTQQEVSAANSESDEERPPLPPKSRKVTEAAEWIPFQKLTSDISQGASSSTPAAEGSSSSLLHLPSCSTQSAPSLESSGRRVKKLTKRELFKNLMLELSNLNPIHEEDLDRQEASGVEVPLSFLTQNSASSDESEKETSFTIEPQQTESAEHVSALSQGVSGRQGQTITIGARKQQKGCGQTSASIIKRSEKEKLSGTKDFERKSPEKPLPSNYIPFSEMQLPTKASEKEGVERTGSSNVRFSASPQGVQRASHTESSDVQTSTSYVSLPQLENRSREFGIKIDKQSSPGQQTSSYVPLSSLKNPALEQTSMSGIFSSEEQASSITYHENQSQASASYVGLSELERQSRKFGTNTQDMQNIPEVASRYVRYSTLKKQSQVPETSPSVSPGSQGHVWVSSILHQSLASFIEIPKQETQSVEYETRVREGIQRSPEQRPVSRNIQSSPSVSQSQKQTSEAGFLSFGTNEQSYDIQSSQGGQNQAAASYVGLPELEKQSREFSIRTAKEQYSPEQQSTSSYVPISAGFQVSGLQSIQRMQTNIEQTSAAGTSDLMKGKLMRQARISDIQRRRSSRRQSPPYYTKLSESERESPEKMCFQNPCTSSYVDFPVSKNQFQRSGICETEHSSEARALQVLASQSEISPPQKESGTSDIVDKLRNLEQASVVGFPEATSQTRNIREGQERTSAANYTKRMLAEKSEIFAPQERRRNLSIGPERRGSGSRTKGMGGSAERSGYAPYPALRSGCTPSPEPVVIPSFQRRKNSWGQIRQRSSSDSLCLEETDKYETQKKETILSINLATGGLVLSKEGAEDETETESSEMSFMYDQPMDVLDLSHIEVPLPPPTDEEVTKGHTKE